jgi:thiol-disulfide isomerase/thioredoxin
MSASWSDLLGKQLSKGKEMVDTDTALADKKHVFLYFSAHWCGPCRRFTPTLASIYSESESHDVEIVFISSDEDENMFQQYYKEMPWLAVPFSEDGRIEALMDRFRPDGIPSLYALDHKQTSVGDVRTAVSKLKSLDVTKLLKND